MLFRSTGRVVQSEKIASIYKEFKGKSLTAEQVEAKVKADMFVALEQQQGDVRTDFARNIRRVDR